MSTLPAAQLPDEPWSNQPLTWLGTAFDQLALRGMRLALDTLIGPPAPDLHRVRASALPYLAAELQGEPRRFFTFLDAPPPAVRMRARRRRRLAGGEVVSREFRTRYEPYHRTPGWTAHPENDLVAVEHWMHQSGPPRATVLALHGFTMGHPWIDAHMLMAPRWFDLGFDVALLTLPFHGTRSPRSARYSGELFASWDVGHLNEAVRQCVYDVDLVKAWLAETTGAPVGLVGLSLGGYVVSLVAGLCADPAFVIALAPPVCLHAVASRLFATAGRRSTTPAALSLPELRRAYRVHSPLTHPLAIARERTLILGARGDGIVPPEHAHALWRHWGNSPVYWFSGSHMAPFRRSLIMARIADHLRGLRLLD
jgi:hypothetical protein